MFKEWFEFVLKDKVFAKLDASGIRALAVA